MPDYTPTTWGLTSYFDIVVPSGQLCKVQRLQLEDLIDLDVLEKIDSLGLAVQEEVIDPIRRPQDHKKKMTVKKDDDSAFSAVIKDKAKFGAMSGLIDKIVAASVVEPKIVLAHREIEGQATIEKIPADERIDGVVYTDSIALEDKMFIFDQCFGGLNKLRQFRDELSEDVGAVADVAEDESDAESIAAAQG